MRFVIFFFVFFQLFFALPDGGKHECSTLPVFTTIASAQESAGGGDANGPINYFASGGIFLLGMVIIWFVFYKLVYPFLLRYYPPLYCKSLFWSMFLLYSMAWISLSAYRLFEIAFHYHWLKWVFVFMGAIWLIWFMVVLLRKDSSYTY